MPTGLDTFKEVVTDFHSVTGLAAKGAVAVPLADLLLDVGPPWPPFISVLASVIELVVLIAVFEYWYTSSRKKQRRRMLVFGIALVATLFGYLFLSSEYTSPHPANDSRLVHGYELRADVRASLQPGEDVEDALEGSEYRPSKVWTSRSITVMRLAMVGTWIGMFASLAAFVAIFVVVQRRR